MKKARSFADVAVPLQTQAADVFESSTTTTIFAEEAEFLQRLSVLEAVSTVDLTKLAENPEIEGCIQGLREALEKDGVVIRSDGTPEALSSSNLVLWGLLHGTPFVAFGFLDNALMLLFADWVDSTWAASAGISTMMACAMGNIVGDVAGLFASNPIEAKIKGGAQRIGLPMPSLSAAQTALPAARAAKTAGCVVGVVVGCILGMLPLIWPTEWRLWASRNTLGRPAVE